MAQLAPSNFVPKQALRPGPDLYFKATANTTVRIIEETLKTLPPIPPGSTIHDNGCGAGEATSAVMATLADPSSVSVKGTDISEPFLRMFAARAAERFWPVEVSRQDASALSFADATFSHSFSNLVVFLSADDGAAALREVHRTLKPGGLAVVTSWKSMPHIPPFRRAVEATRPVGTPAPRVMPPRWESLEYLKERVVQGGGFAEEHARASNVDIVLEVTDLREWITILWSLLGAPATGWLESDEERWDEAISMIVDGVKLDDGYEDLGDGAARLKLVANVVVASKDV